MQVELHDGYIRAFCEGAFPRELLAALTYTKRGSGVDSKTYQRRMTFTKEEVFDISLTIDDSGKALNCLTTMPGFASRMLADPSCTSVRDLRTPMPEPNIKRALEGMRPYQREGVVHTILSGGGVFHCPTGWGKTRVSAAIINAYDREDLIVRNTPLTVVTTYDTGICKQTYESLRKILPHREIGILMTGATKRSEDIQVVSLDSLHKVDPSQIGILLIDEVHEAASERRAAKISRIPKARRWGFSASPDGRFDNADLVTEGLVGPVVYHRTYQQGVDDGALVPIEVIWVDAPPPPCGVRSFHQKKNRETKYRLGVDRNPAFAKLVAEIMNEIPDALQTLCIMQHTAQMDTLSTYMPGVAYVHAKTQRDALVKGKQFDLNPVTTKERQELYDRFSGGELRKIMSTYVYKQGVDFPDLAVLMQVGGGGSKIASTQIPGRASRITANKDVSYVLDFVHPWDHTVEDGKKKNGTLLRDDKSRARKYKQLGFKQLHMSKEDAIQYVTRKHSI